MASLRDFAATLRNQHQVFTNPGWIVNPADAETDTIDLDTWTSPRAGESAPPVTTPALSRRRGHGYELAPPSHRDLIARAVVPTAPHRVPFTNPAPAPTANRTARRRLPRPLQKASGIAAAALLGPMLASALPVGQVAASASPTVATTTTTTTGAAAGAVGADTTLPGDPAASTTTTGAPAATALPGAPTTLPAPTTAPIVAGAAATTSPATTTTTTTAAATVATTPGRAETGTTTTTAPPAPGATSSPTSTTTVGASAAPTTTASDSTTSTTADPTTESTTTTTVPVAAATEALPVGEIVLPPASPVNDPLAATAQQALVLRHTDEQAQIELLWTQTAREAADQRVDLLTAEVGVLSAQAFETAASGASSIELDQQRAVVQGKLDDARRDAATMALRQAAAAAVAEQSAAAFAGTRRALADAVATRAGVDGAKLDASWVATSAARLDVMFAALSQVGDPYVWAATGPDTFDCSGLTGFAWKAAGITLPHYTVSQRQTTLAVDEAHLQPADLVFNLAGPNGGHVMMFLGIDHVIVEAPATGQLVSISSWRSTTGFGSPLDDANTVVVTDGAADGTPPTSVAPGF